MDNKHEYRINCTCSSRLYTVCGTLYNTNPSKHQTNGISIDSSIANIKSSGVGVRDDAIEVFQDLKLKKKYKYIIYKLSDDNKEIIVEKTVGESSYDDFVSSLPAEECRYCVYDFHYETDGEGTRHKLLFYVW